MLKGFHKIRDLQLHAGRRVKGISAFGVDKLPELNFQ